MNTELTLKAVTALVAVGGLVFGIIKFIQVQQIEASKPYLQKKLEWCTEAVETASAIASSDGKSEDDERRFWQLYWGVMGMVENRQVTNAMIAFGKELESKRDLKNKALAIAHACRSEMANDWSSSWAR